ncbi:hypothetical protein JZ751_027672 [Albula glossodonta]|uniref:Bromodomain adjacent to zinc finger domain protein 2B n=1 Tax=Albula glossodonta TaxID=121402 RepID=A0A8T2PAI0_9TELE|nr:hypothetical protein JZ751_027672 [Albula glossodonta]
MLRRSPCESKKEGPRVGEDKDPQDRKSSQPRSFPPEAPPPAHLSPQPPPSQRPVLSQTSPLIFPSSKAKEEGGGAGGASTRPHQSVIQSIGLAASSKPLALVTQPRREASSPSPLTPLPKPLPLTLSPSPKPAAPSPDGVRTGSRNLLPEPLSQINDFRLKPPFLSQELKKQQELFKAQKKVVTSPSLPPPKLSPQSMGGHKLTAPPSKHSNLFLSNTILGQHPNGVIQSAVQDAPLALITKPRDQARVPDKSPVPVPAPSASFPAPVNLSTGSKGSKGSQVISVVRARPSTSPGRSRSTITPIVLPSGKPLSQSHLAQSLVEMFRASESDIPSSKDSDDSAEDDEDEDDEEEEDEDEDSDDSPSESESNLESNSDGSEDDMKDRDEMETDTEGEKTPLKLTKSASSLNTTSNHSANCSPLNLIKTPSTATSTTVTGAGVPAYHCTPSSSYVLSTPPGSGKRRRVMDERELRIPLELGWQRETRIQNLGGRMQGDVTYYAPCGKKLRQYPDVVKGLQWTLLKEEDIIPRILAMEGRRGRPPNPDRQQPGDGSRTRRRKGRPPNVGEPETPSTTNAKLLRKLEAQEIARQAAQIKLMRKLEKQALARAAKEARKQQAIMAAEEKRKQKEQIKIMKQQEKIKRIQQIRMEKELRAQQILEEKELRRQQAVILKHQERERRRQHMMLMKAMEARKKAEEKERLKQEKRDEKRLNKERKLELRRLELEIAKELKKPNEDMCLADHKPLPELSRIPGLVLPGSTFSDCLMVMQFLRSFGKVLGFDVSTDVPTLGVLQEGLLNVGESMGETKTALGDHLTNVGINRDNVSEILQIYMEAHCGQTELAELTESLKTKAFQAHTPTQKASVLAFLVNELACSKCVVSEIDKNIDHMTNLRRDKWVIEGKLRKLRIIHAKKTGKRESGMGGEETQPLGTPTAGRKRKRKAGDSDEDEDEDEDSDDQGDEDDDEEEEGKKGKKVETCEDERYKHSPLFQDEGDQTASVEELEKQIEKLTKQQSQIRRKLFEASHSLRSMMFGQDRYKRRYWEVEKERERLKNTETLQIKEEPPEVVEEKPVETSLDLNFERTTETPETAKEEKASPNLFLQKPDSFSKLSKLLEVAKMSPESEEHQQKENGSPQTVPATASSPVHMGFQAGLPSSPPAAPAPPCTEPKPDPASVSVVPALPHLGSPGKRTSPHPLLPNDQLFRVLTEKSGHWFSLLPRSPCDDTSLTSNPTPDPVPRPGSPQPASSGRPKSPSSSSPTPPIASASASPHHPNPTGINSFAFSAVQVKPGMHLMGVPFCGWPSGMLSPNMAFSGSPLPPMLAPGYPMVEGNGSPFLAPSISTSKSDSPVPPSEKPPSAPSPVVEVAKPQDYPVPQPIPEEMLTGWWRVADMEELRSLVKVLHSRGIREKALQKQIQKHMEYIAQACAKNRDAAIIDVSEMEENQVTEETLASWCVEEQAMEMDIAVLQQVEELERKVTSASLQVKGWIYPEPHSEREDLVYYEHKPSSKLCPAKDKEAGESQEEKEGSRIVRRVNNPLDIAVTRLAELERNIERRYLKTPLGTTIQIKLDNVGTVTAPAPSSSADGEGGEEDIAPGMKVWRKALSEVRSAAQLALCIQQLQKSIAWEKQAVSLRRIKSFRIDLVEEVEVVVVEEEQEGQEEELAPGEE